MSDEPYTPDNVPPDTDQYIYRYVTKFRGDGTAPQVFSELTQIWIQQP